MTPDFDAIATKIVWDCELRTKHYLEISAALREAFNAGLEAACDETTNFRVKEVVRAKKLPVTPA